MPQNAPMKIITPSLRTLMAVGAVGLLAAACGGGSGGSQWTYAPVPSVAASPGGSPGTSPGGSAPVSPGGSPATSPAQSPAGSPAQSPAGSPAVSPGGSPARSPAQSPAASPPASPGGSPAGSPSASETIALTETASVQITQDGQPVSNLTVKNGQTYTFSITNEAGFVHNFFIGPPDALEANNVAGLSGVPDFAEGTKEFQYTVTDETASLEFACTVLGHYPSMHGTFTVEP